MNGAYAITFLIGYFSLGALCLFLYYKKYRHDSHVVDLIRKVFFSVTFMDLAFFIGFIFWPLQFGIVELQRRVDERNRLRKQKGSET
jgi:hypothetical protein